MATDGSLNGGRNAEVCPAKSPSLGMLRVTAASAPGSRHTMILPPATSSVTPVIHAEASEARNSVAAATSSG